MTRRPRSSSRIALLSALLLAGLLATLVAGCAPGGDTGDWPAQIRAAPAVVRQAYAYAHDHPDVLKALPCYCGCGSIGHTSNYACYISGTDAEGQIVYDDHALACSICVDITLDAQRLLNEGHTLEEVRAQIDAKYSPFGPSNMPDAQ